MNQHSATLLTWEKASALLIMAAIFLLTLNTRLTSGKFSGSSASVNHGLPATSTVLWHAGNFRYLNALPDKLLTYVDTLPHPTGGAYRKLSSTRKASFNLFLDALFKAIDDSLADGSTGDWCGVKAKAADANYEVIRFYDTDTGRWFIHGYDKTSDGQAYFFINPFAKRNIVIEVPHERYEPGTALEGARLFTALAARALIINNEDRCSSPTATGCNIGTTTACADGRVRESDMAHEVSNAFYLLHVRYTDMDPVTKFVQLHGFNYDPMKHAQKVVIGDSSTKDILTTSVSVTFANNLKQFVPTDETAAVESCQQSAGKPNPSLCGEASVEGRYANNPLSDACANFTSNSKSRFLHIEQAPTVRDDDDSDGWYWGDINEALIRTWGGCNMNNGATDCTLGSQQTQYSTWTCP